MKTPRGVFASVILAFACASISTPAYAASSAASDAAAARAASPAVASSASIASDSGSKDTNSVGTSVNSAVQASQSTQAAVKYTEVSFDGTVLIIAPDKGSAKTVSYLLDGYGIHYDTLVVPKEGVDLPELFTTSGSSYLGNYGLIFILSEASYNYGTDGNDNWHSALTTAQWQQIYDYQLQTGVRLIQLNVWPNDLNFGAIALGGCCNEADDQDVQVISAAATAHFPYAGIKNAVLSTKSLYHVPSIVSDKNKTRTVSFLNLKPNAQYAKTTSGGVINTFADGRKQMVFFFSFGTWSQTSTLLLHIALHWGTRTVYSGMRRSTLSTQIDDLFLETGMYYKTIGDSPLFRLRKSDLASHASWTKTINTQLTNKNPGSEYFLEFGFNGNGNLIFSNVKDPKYKTCTVDPIYYDSPDDTPLEFQKEIGTGTDVWPTEPSTFTGYTQKCLQLDPMATWMLVPENRDNFAFVTHTFTHMALNNATYKDTTKEITWNQWYANFTSLKDAKRFSPRGIIPPAITGLHNGDALRAFMENGVLNAVGDNTRPVLRNKESIYWPLMTTVENNGRAGFQITPRYSTAIYYNCDTPACCLKQWTDTSSNRGDFQDLMNVEKQTTVNNLLTLQHDAYMFHQANLRHQDMPTTTITGANGKLSLIQLWVKTVTAEFLRVVNWPLISVKHDDLADMFADRMALDLCDPNIRMLLSSDKTTITGVEVTAGEDNKCSVPVPVTLPGSVSDTKGMKTEQVGNDPYTIWVKMAGQPVKFALSTPVKI